MILGVDVSAWQSPLSIPWAQLKSIGVQFAIVKGDQATATANHIALAREAGCLVGEYFWHDPTQPPATQAEGFLEDCRTNQPDFVFLDIEQWWSNWAAWRMWQYERKIPQSQVPVANKGLIDFSAKTVMDYMARDLACPVGTYSAKWFIDQYAPGIATWISSYPFWVANYIQETVHEATWAEIQAGPPENAVPVLPNRVTDWFIWQWSSHKRLPGKMDTIDLNLFPGTLAGLQAWAGAAEQPALTIEERVAKLEAEGRLRGWAV